MASVCFKVTFVQRHWMAGVCIVSGCSRGIGRAVAARLAKEGYALGLLSRNEQEINRLKEELASSGFHLFSLRDRRGFPHRCSV